MNVKRPLLDITVGCALVVLAPAAASASASQDVCSAIPKATFAHIAGLPKSAVQSERYGPDTCEIDAWSGSKPRAEQFETRLKSRTLAVLEMRTFTAEPNESLSESEQGAPELEAGIKLEFRRFDLKSQSFSPPALGADSSGGVSGSGEESLREDRGFWTSTSKHSTVFVTVLHADRKAAVVQTELVKAATIIVPALGI